MQWFGYKVVITCEVVTKEKLKDIEQGREEPNPFPTLDITGKNFKTTTVSAQQIEQKVERVTQSIANWLGDHVNQEIGQLEAIVSKNTNLNDEGQNGNRHDRYCPVQVAQNVLRFLDKQMGFHSKLPKLNLFSGEEVPGKHEISFNRWLFEVRTIQQSYAETLVWEAIIRSVRGWAADLVSFLGTNADVEKIISKFETVYGTVLGYDVLMHHLYGVHVERN